MLLEKERMTIAMKKISEIHCRGFLRAFATLGRNREVRMPRVSGMPSRMKMVLNTSHSGMTRVGISCATGAKCR